MANVNIEITLQDGEVGDRPRRYEPGSTLRGWVRLTPEDIVNANRVVVRLEWHTEGRGDRNHGSAGEVQLATGPLSGPLVQPFTLTVPHDPWSYTGHYITIIWAVVVVVDVRHARDIRHEEPIVVAPHGQAPGPPPAATPQTEPSMPTLASSFATTSNSRVLWIMGIVIVGAIGLFGLAIGLIFAGMDRHPPSTPRVEASPEDVPAPETAPSPVTATTAGVPTKAAPPRPTPATIADGTGTVGVDIPAGVYRTTNAGSDCFWEIRKSGTTGTGGIVGNQLGAGLWTIKLRAGQDFETDGCGSWTKITTPLSPAIIPDGTWNVGADIPAGTYRTTRAGSDCFWEIKSGTNGSNDSGIVDNQLGGGPWTVALRAGQDFETDGCGSWTKIK
jgi:hypothetical protein